MAIDVIHDSQKKQGTYRQHLSQLMMDFSKLMENGGGTKDTFERMLAHLLKSFEGVRLKEEAEIRGLNKKLAVHEANIRSCNTFSNMLLGLVKTYAEEAAGRETTNVFTQTVRFVEQNEGKSNGEEKPKRISDVEARKLLCKCCCVDEEDAKNCDCECHTVGYCSDPECAVCMEKKAKIEEEKEEAEKSNKKTPVRAKRFVKKKTNNKKK